VSVPTTPSPTAGGAEGERLRDEALDRLRLCRAALVRRVQRVYLDQLLTHGPSTSDPVRALVPIPPRIDPRLVGAAVRQLAELGLLRRAGLGRSERPEAHRRDLAVWEVADRDAAVAWLAAHPDLPDPEPPAPGRQLTLWD
jgi:hypothetical protein